MPLLRLVVAQEKLEQRGFAAAAGPHNGRNAVVGDVQADVVQHKWLAEGVVFEADVLNVNIFSRGRCAQRGGGAGGVLLVGLVVDFVHALEAQAHILPRVDEANELLYGGIELTNDVLHGQHHAQRHVAVDYGGGGQHSGEYVF